MAGTELSAFIYALSDPRNPKIPRYIGKTKNPIRKRTNQAWASRNSCTNPRLKAWLKELESLQLFPVAYELERVTVSTMKDRETHWIRFFRPLGTLTNLSDGDGSLGIKKGPPCLANRLKTIERNKRGHSEATKAKLREQRLGKKLPAHQVQNWKSTPGFQVAMQKFKQCNETRKKPVIAKETGQTFHSVADAIRELGCTDSGFREAMRMGWKCRGFHWQFVHTKE